MRGGQIWSPKAWASADKNGLIDCSEILQRFLNSYLSTFCFWGGPPRAPPPVLLRPTHSMRGVRSDQFWKSIPNRQFSPQDELFRSKSIKIKFLATFVLLITPKKHFLDHFWVSEKSTFKSDQIWPPARSPYIRQI